MSDPIKINAPHPTIGIQSLLSTDDAAKVLCVCAKTVRVLVKRGDLTCVRIGTSVRFHPDDLTDFICRARTGATTNGQH